MRIGIPVLIAGPTTSIVAQVALRHLPSTAPTAGARSRRRSQRRCREAEPAQGQQVGEGRPELVLGGLAHGGKAPVLGDLGAAGGKDAEVRLGVAYVDDEQHRRITSVPGRPGGPPGPGRALPAASARRSPPGRRSSGSSSSRGTSTKRRELPRGEAGSAAGVWTRSPSRSTSTSMTRGPCRAPPAARPTSRSTALHVSSSGSGSSSVSIRRQALKSPAGRAPAQPARSHRRPNRPGR